MFPQNYLRTEVLKDSKAVLLPCPVSVKNKMDCRNWPTPSQPPTSAPPATPHKRAYVPSSLSLVSDIKKRRLLHGMEGIQPPPQTPPRGRPSTVAQDWTSTESPFNVSRGCSQFYTPQRPRLPSDFLSREAAELMQISQRPKFKARPVPKTQYQPSIVIRASDKPLTVPVELAVFTHARSFSCASRCSTEEMESASSFKAREMPDFSRVNLPEKREFTPTQPQPFDLKTEERGREKSISMQHKLQIEAQNQLQATQFTANPLPIFLPPKPVICTRPQTVPQPFHLRPASTSTLPSFPAFNAFRARPMPDFSVPFQPLRPGTHTEPMDVELHSDIQSQHRALFEEKIRERQRHEQQFEASKASESLLREAEEIKRLRRQMEFEARPMPSPSKFVVQRSSQLLTVPAAPYLHTAERAAMRSQCSENCNPNLSQSQSHASTHCSEVSMSLCEEEAMDTLE